MEGPGASVGIHRELTTKTDSFATGYLEEGWSTSREMAESLGTGR